MKRSVAITGRTPPFLRWAIASPCPFRDVDLDNLPQTTFRQLRAVREWSLASIENRVFEGTVIHPDATPEDPSAALGFPVDEITHPWGGAAVLLDGCTRCAANIGNRHSATGGPYASSAPESCSGGDPGRSKPGHPIAGCFGGCAIDLDTDFNTILRGQNRHPAKPDGAASSRPNLVEQVEHVVERAGLRDEIGRRFLLTKPVWYGLWERRVLRGQQLELLERLFRQVQAEVNNLPPQGNAGRETDLDRLVEAFTQCRANNLRLHVDYIPEGHSDGQTWTLPRHCGRCRFVLTTDGNVTCPACQTKGQQENARRFRVLGLRPYLHLQTIYGSDSTKKMLQAYFADAGETRPKA